MRSSRHRFPPRTRGQRHPAERPPPVPLPAAPTPLQDSLEHGVSLGGQYVEVYEDDLLDSRSQPVLATESAKLKANVPPDGVPASPTNLRVTP